MYNQTSASKRRKVAEELKALDLPKKKSDPLLGFVCAQLPEEDLAEDCAAFQEKPEVQIPILEKPKPTRKRKIPSESQKLPKIEPEIKNLHADELQVKIAEKPAEEPIDDMRDLIGNSGVGSIGDFNLI